MHPKLAAMRAGEIRHALAQLRGRAQGAQHIIVVRNWGAEQRHDCIADMLIDRATVPFHDLVRSGEITVKQRMQEFIRQVARQGRKSAEIGEQHGHRLPLRIESGRRSRLRRRLVELRDRLQQSTAMADGVDADIAQIVGGKPPQRGRVDMVERERGRVFFQSELPQPGRYVHWPTPRGRSTDSLTNPDEHATSATAFGLRAPLSQAKPDGFLISMAYLHVNDADRLRTCAARERKKDLGLW